jgi:hypothetical protein
MEITPKSTQEYHRPTGTPETPDTTPELSPEPNPESTCRESWKFNWKPTPTPKFPASGNWATVYQDSTPESTPDPSEEQVCWCYHCESNRRNPPTVGEDIDWIDWDDLDIFHLGERDQVGENPYPSMHCSTYNYN